MSDTTVPKLIPLDQMEEKPTSKNLDQTYKPPEDPTWKSKWYVTRMPGDQKKGNMITGYNHDLQRKCGYES